MRLGMLLRYHGDSLASSYEVLEAERLGYHSVWCGEAYGNDAVTPHRLGPGAHHQDQGRHRHHADAGAHAGLRGHDRAHPAGHCRTTGS